MKKLILAAIAIFHAGSAYAGLAYAPVTRPAEGGDATGAMVLLALIGVVIAGSAMGGFATRDATTMIPDAPEEGL